MEEAEGNLVKRIQTPLDVFKAWVRRNAEDFVAQAEVTAGCQEFPKAEGFDRTHEVEAEMVVTQFYDGTIADSNPSEYTPDPQFCKTKESPTGWKIHMKDIFVAKDGKTPRKITLTGPAGSGKTTALKRFVRDNPDDFIFVLCGSNFERNGNAKLSLFEFLFPNREGISEGALNTGFEWMKANYHEITFALDSLDTLPFKVNTDDLIMSDIEGHHSAAGFLSSIMARSLFFDCRMVSSSREHGIAGYPKELRADRIISLVGLTKESIQKHVNFVLKHDDTETKSFCEVVERRHAGLWALCATPLFLVFTLIGYKKGQHSLQESFPSTMSGIMVKLLQDLFLSPHGKPCTRHTAKKVHDIMDKLKMLSYLGILKNKVTFSEDDLSDAVLKPEEATALSIFVPFCESRKLSQSVLRGRKLLFFCHQCVQEILSAMFIIEMKLEDFKKFVDEELNKPKLSVVRRFLSGLLLNEQVYHAALQNNLLQDPSDTKEKRKVLQQHLKERLVHSYNNKKERLELYISLHEAGDGVRKVIRSGMHYINLHGLQQLCTVSDAHAIGSIVKYCDRLSEFNLSDCDLTPEKIQSLDSGIDFAGVEKRIQVNKLRLKYNWNMGADGILVLGSMLKKFGTSKLVLEGCRVDAHHLNQLQQRFAEGNIKVEKLFLGEQEGFDASEEMLTAVCTILPHVSKCLNLQGWLLDLRGKNFVEEALRAQKLKDEKYSTGVIYGIYGEHRIEPERLEDVFDELCRRFPISAMRRFALQSNGLKLAAECVRDVQDGHRGIRDVNAERMAYLQEWKVANGNKATASKLRQISENYTPFGHTDSTLVNIQD